MAKKTARKKVAVKQAEVQLVSKRDQRVDLIILVAIIAIIALLMMFLLCPYCR
jgi:hypothetical protein